MKVTIYQKKGFKLSKQLVKKAVELTLEDFDEKCDEVILHFVDKETIAQLHADHFDDPTPTDCISFPYNSEAGYRILGEVFVCPEVAKAYAEKHNKDPEVETLLYVVHGLLHLLGYDDQTPAEKRQMRKLEKRALKRILMAEPSLEC